MIKQREILRKIMIIAKNASMRANGANIEKKEKLQNNNLEQLLQRKNKFLKIYHETII